MSAYTYGILMTCGCIHSAMQELESNLNSLHQRFVAERSFAMREHERDMAELITYDDMEFVTVQLEEECQQKISVCTVFVNCTMVYVCVCRIRMWEYEYLL